MVRFIKSMRVYLSDFIKFFIIYMPGSTGRKIRYAYYRGKFKKCGKNVFIEDGVIIMNPQWISIGNNVWIHQNCILAAGPTRFPIETIVKRKANKNFKWQEGELIIGDNVYIAPFCIIHAQGDIFIGNNCGFASGVKLYSISNLPNNPYRLPQQRSAKDSLTRGKDIFNSKRY